MKQRSSVALDLHDFTGLFKAFADPVSLLILLVEGDVCICYLRSDGFGGRFLLTVRVGMREAAEQSSMQIGSHSDPLHADVAGVLVGEFGRDAVE